MTRTVNLVSDTVTQPTPEMREAMASAVVGDDGSGDDPTVNELESTFAALVAKPAALFVPSGVMANQIAVRVLTSPGDVVLAGRSHHVVSFEMGAAARNASVQFATVDDGSQVVTVGTDGVAASNLVVRVVGGVTPTTALPACGSLRGEPCRTYQAEGNQA